MTKKDSLAPKTYQMKGFKKRKSINLKRALIYTVIVLFSVGLGLVAFLTANNLV